MFPEFGDSIVIKKGRNPILDLLSKDECVGNDVLCCAGHEFSLISGVNMVPILSAKSIVLMV